MNSAINIDALSPEEIQALSKQLEQKKAAEAKKRDEARQKYESRKEKVINTLGKVANSLSERISVFKRNSFEALLDLRDEMLEYGELRNGLDNKGSFTIKNDNYKIDVKTQVKMEFDERADLAAKHLKAYQDKLVKKGSREVMAFLSAALWRNEKTNKYDPDAILRLYTLEDQILDEDFQKAIKLYKESYAPVGTKMYVKFSKKDEHDKWQSIIIDYASAEFAPEDTESKE